MLFTTAMYALRLLLDVAKLDASYLTFMLVDAGVLNIGEKTPPVFLDAISKLFPLSEQVSNVQLL